MKFRSCYEETHRRFFGAHCDGCEPEFERQYDTESQKYILFQRGTKDVYKVIQKSAEGIDLKSLLARYVAGDETALNASSGYFVDLTKVPKDLFEAELMSKNARRQWDELSSDVKKAFGNSYIAFLSDMSKGDFSKLSSVKFETKSSEPQPLFTADQINFIKENIK